MYKARDLLDIFISNANKDVPHPLDDQRFYDFVIYCHKNSEEIDSSDLLEKLLDSGFSESRSRDLVNLYEHGQDLLKRYDIK